MGEISRISSYLTCHLLNLCLNLILCSSLILCLILCLSLIPVSKFDAMPKLEKTITVLDNERFGKVYSRKKMAIPRSTQVQASNPTPMNEVTLSESSLHDEIESCQDLPIAIRKRTRECT
jgi:hypothetical protein